MIMDANSGNFEGFVDGNSIGVYAGIGVLPTHGNDCGFAQTQGNTKFHSGGNSNAANLKGRIAEFYEFGSALSPADRAILENSLFTKYGITP
jgi:hypothetical protein